MLISKSHDCPFCGSGHSNPCFAIYDDGFHCFSCGETERKHREFRIYKSNKLTSGLFVPEYESNPKNFSPSILSWLYKYYIFEDSIYEHNIKYVAYDKFKTHSGLEFEGESLILPVCVSNEIVAYQRRFFPKKQVLSIGYKKDVICLMQRSSRTDEIVLVEDYISAIRVSKFSDCISLNGTTISRDSLNYISRLYSKIRVWLDSDEPGQKAAKNINNQLVIIKNAAEKRNPFSFTKTEIINTVTEEDPKCYTDTQINETLNRSE